MFSRKISLNNIDDLTVKGRLEVGSLGLLQQLCPIELSSRGTLIDAAFHLVV